MYHRKSTLVKFQDVLFLMVYLFHVLPNHKKLGDPQGCFYCPCFFTGSFYRGHNTEPKRTPQVAIEILTKVIFFWPLSNVLLV